ncbi:MULTISPECIES: polysaccharide biosynthesis tyrosine autokinase [unclassified Colwellia]|jgi:succinoglycan biosynthesis transport protein ExoP|uniref:GumC family protein n=1 Tax=unclassified Colwellia TaxID=196834 RepID=UPI0015F425E2|nr:MULTISPECIES: polysaccharide biosynthesis tyrosine autokinase [unclassified Colwellia]MBA6353835.1 polysaccharide biosynthesis tyrosine autokinase [Colwellia sp. BRX9-1]MBA6356787.1 polysaccharide biosynthesis tyrosine autokinase [Colwellia sp. BRX8-3]MBA6360400.1 polysaccharide biosynthesis tyrosine autokinase [Colwellia sp. BRX8-6]MBA6368750.1 polysaccharide biosynthesis tyrosine autokinase [Colwellia sp. BRX8-5]MBA6374474.1 polysaccharide biosynthesis tyrosine autokinase [Colwellia sp. B
MLNDNQSVNFNAPNQEIDLKEVLRPLWSRRWQIVFFTLLVSLMVSFYVSLLKPSFKATAILQIGSNKPANTLSINDAFNESSASKEQVKTQYELLKSRKFAERVIISLNLVEHQEFNSGKYNDKISFFADIGKRTSRPTVSSLISIFESRLTIAPIASTELVKISFAAHSPQLAQKVANQIGLTYLQYQDEIHSASKESTSQWLVDQLEELEKKLETSEQALQEYREAEGIVDILGIAGLVSSELTELTSSAIRAEKIKDDLEVTYQSMQKRRKNTAQLLELQEISQQSDLVQLRRADEKAARKIFELSKRYGPKHPKRIAVQAELESLQKGIVQLVDEIVISIEKDYLNSSEKVKATNNRLAIAKVDYLRLSRLQNKFSQLQREVDTNKELYNNYLVRLKETDAMGNYKANFYVRFIDKAIIPTDRFAPKKALIVIMSFMLSFAIIAIIIIMREISMDTLNSRRKLDSFTEAPVLAILPKFQAPSAEKKSDPYYTDNRFTEAVRTLRTSLLFNGESKPAKVIAITSSVPNEGKSTIALHLARSFSEMEKVLLIEADMRHPTVAKNMNLSPHRPGLSNLLAKTHQINECIIRDKNLKLDILTSGISPANPLVFLSMKRLNMLIKVFGNFYDRIIIETPPVNAVSDAAIISKLVETVLYVVHGEKTKREQITTGLRMLKQVNAPIEGIIINHSQSIDADKYQNKYYNERANNIVKLPVRKQG